MSFFGFLSLFARLKWRQANNHILGLRRLLWIHLTLGLFVVVLLVGGGTVMFSLVFEFLMAQEPFGRPLMDRLIRMVLLAFFSMLIFSNLIIMLTTTYISREVEFLMSQPIRHRHLFLGKLVESVVYSSWAFVILAFPLFVAIGRSRDISDPLYYLWTALLVAPFLVIPATLGSAIALVITRFFPPRRMIRLAIALAVVGLTGAALMQRFYGVSRFFARGVGRPDELARVMRFLGVGDLSLLPSGWLGRGGQGAERGDNLEAAFWAFALWATAAMGIVICDWLAGPFYYIGWCNARTSGTGRRTRAGGLYAIFDRLFSFVPRPTRAFLTKDLVIFWRDPGQWGQLMILFGLLFIYVANLRSAAHMGHYEIFVPFWQSVISMFNIGATAFVLSILTTRFVYPMLSLEGRQQWAIGLAPMPRTRVVWVKFLMSWVGSVLLTLPLAVLSARMLDAAPFIYLFSILTVVAVSAGLSALAVGLGAAMPNFNEDNPSRIANGIGGTLNAILSLVYIGLTLTFMTPWIHAYVSGGVPTRGWLRTLYYLSHPLWWGLQFAFIVVPMATGLRRWRRMEF